MIEKTTIKNKDRQNNYDLLRVLSTIAVIFIHANWRCFGDRYAQMEIDSSWICESIINIITRFSVPCFVMLSGAFMLAKDDNKSAKTFYKKTTYKIFFPAGVIIVIECILTMLFNMATHNKIYSGLTGLPYSGIYNLWYLYMLAGLYALTPLIIRIRASLDWNSYRTLGVVLLIWAIISQTTSTQRMAYSIGVVIAYSSFYILGDILYHDAKNDFIQQKKAR